MIEQINMALIIQYAGLNPFLGDVVIIVAKYMPVIFVILLIYFWIKKEDKHKDIVLYCIYATILGLIITFSMQFITHAENFSDNIIFMLSVALMMIYFQETRKTSLILLILGLIESFIMIAYNMYIPLIIFESFGVSIISTIIIYTIRKKLTSLNQIFRLIYQILK